MRPTVCAHARRTWTPRDAGFASQIVFGTLRFRAQLDYLIRALFRQGARQARPAKCARRSGPPSSNCAISSACPSHAVVHEAVELVKATKRSAAGFRQCCSAKSESGRRVAWPDRATELSCPAWLLERWGAHFGERSADGIAASALVAAAALHTNRARATPDPAGSHRRSDRRSRMLSASVCRPIPAFRCTTSARSRFFRCSTCSPAKLIWTSAPLPATKPARRSKHR